MFVRRILLSVRILGEESFFCAVNGNSLPGATDTIICEERAEDGVLLTILDGTLLDLEEKKRWLKDNVGKDVWLRVTGTVELSGFSEGVAERSDTEVHVPDVQHVIKAIAVEILSDHELREITATE